MKTSTIFILIFLFINSSISAQNIRGADFAKSIINRKLTIRLDVYREGQTKDSVYVFWGDGPKGPILFSYLIVAKGL